MGLFDYVTCEYPLPEGAPTKGYQTKDTPSQYLDTYTLTADGRLVNEAGEDSGFHGALNFYATNVGSIVPWLGYTTDDGKPAEFWDFVALFKDGRLIDLRGGKEEPEGFYRHPPLSDAVWRAHWNQDRPEDWEARANALRAGPPEAA